MSTERVTCTTNLFEREGKQAALEYIVARASAQAEGLAVLLILTIS